MGTPRTAVAKGSLSYLTERGTISLPVFVYRADDDLELFESHIRHVSDMGRIRYRYHCEACDSDVSNGDVVKIVDYDGEPTGLTREQVMEVLERTEDIIIKGSVPVAKVAQLLGEGALSFVDRYFVTPMKVKKSKGYEMLPVAERQFRLLLDALAKTGQALFVEVPFVSRFGYLFPSGDLFTVRYAQEMRDRPGMMFDRGEGYKKAELQIMTKFIKGIEIDPVIPDVEPMKKKVDSFIIKARKKPSITAKERKNNVEDFMKTLMEVVGAKV